MVLGLRRVNIIWKLLRNCSGFILELLEIDLEQFFNQKVNILIIFLHINSENLKKSSLIFNSQHLVMNPGQGPAIKCAPGHKSIEDSNIIKS